ncbi:SDR family NAD(P)-dependent oxidoreductase [Cloacibacillus sp. An23]|uniref:SDR family NAD(P)-dependent oxidoreductase n=1 Tax=Cloacibacillus sp. An23 TaxID=1965591 RepID=UPI000B375605|nr:SDR family NAD(P)-dependent oxidoreductase [Cloacibacillus sp. An23]OUO93509.1 2-deoxy-D-gluconate 3-dehydrogenase [Cloacibacillus sp. An23]
MNVKELFDIEGKKAIVTGGGRGLCRAMAEALHEAGAEVLIIGRNESVLAEAAREMGAEGAPVLYEPGDLGELDKIKQLYERALAKLGGRLDILVNGAGVQYRAFAEEFPFDEWQRVIAVNLSAVFRLSQLAGRTMLAQGRGKIINVASMTSFFGSERIPAYAASKGGVAQLTKALANEWTSRGVCVNAVAPGYMETALTKDIKTTNPRYYEEITGRIPAHRWGRAEDLKGVTVFLSSAASDYISGAVIPVDGGYLGK